MLTIKTIDFLKLRPTSTLHTQAERSTMRGDRRPQNKPATRLATVFPRFLTTVGLSRFYVAQGNVFQVENPRGFRSTDDISRSGEAGQLFARGREGVSFAVSGKRPDPPARTGVRHQAARPLRQAGRADSCR